MTWFYTARYIDRTLRIFHNRNAKIATSSEFPNDVSCEQASMDGLSDGEKKVRRHVKSWWQIWRATNGRTDGQNWRSKHRACTQRLSDTYICHTSAYRREALIPWMGTVYHWVWDEWSVLCLQTCLTDQPQRNVVLRLIPNFKLCCSFRRVFVHIKCIMN